MRTRIQDSIAQANDTGIDLLFTDIELAATMLERAEITEDQETRRRNVRNVIQACASIRHFMEKLELSDAQRSTLTTKLERLGQRLAAFDGH